ncbi:MAG TPA: DUF418 domain-containing protein [Flavobacterium sp.]|uniref:DUF418 domain-containing protein n=1 Tax=Flavobacterium sp. TaxID=239 RepID=UPI002C1B19B3|nr:DUF418 domain-containing protein [Flavobacterium sp.]HSD13355.1 DUF418 domain-containing protein [Flavobacterium sp.]
MNNPTPKSTRATILDVLRGIALFGVFISNLGVFTGYVFLSPEHKTKLATAALDPFFDFFHFAFIDGKFYSIFSLLFGIGFGIFLSKTNGLSTFYKRLFILIGFGIAHAFLLWEGDILLLYALLGLFLPFFSSLSNKVLLWISIALILSPIALDSYRVASNHKFAPEIFFFNKAQTIESEQQIKIESGEDFIRLIQTGEYSQIKKLLVPGFFYRWGGLFESNRLPKVFGLFLIGMMIGRNKWHEDLENKKDFLIKWRKRLFVFGFPATLAFAYYNVVAKEQPEILEAVLYAFSVIPIAFVYVCTIVLFFLKNKNHFYLFAHVGKMTLTNYILQSCLAYLLFYGTGLALFGKIGSIVFPLIAIIVYVIQVYFSKLWLNRFEFGPLEWIWRQLTYGKLIPLRK